MKSLLPMVLILFGLLTATVNAQTRCPAERIEDCPETGCGGWDKQLDLRKNFTSYPNAQPPKPFSLEQIKELQYPNQWFTGKDRRELEALGEGMAVQVVAYLVGVRSAGPASANCKLADRSALNDLLILVSEDALSKKKAQREATSVTAEITARVRLHQARKTGGKLVTNWNKEKLEALIRNSPNKVRLVRISGVLLLDTEHDKYTDTENDKYPTVRYTDWEIHPVLAIDVCMKRNKCTQEEDWKKLDDIRIVTTESGSSRGKRRSRIRVRP
jgi:hypothetical protein